MQNFMSIYNLSFSRPRSLLTGVTPAANAPHTTDPNLFRRLGLTSIVCKVLEAILKEKKLVYLPQFSLLASRRHGLLHRHSTPNNLLVAEEFITKWLDEGSAVDLAYLKPLIWSTIVSF